MVNKHTVNYHPSPSQLITRIDTLIFLWAPKGFMSPEYFLIFFLNLYTPPWLQKSFKIIMLRLLQIHLWVKKLNLFIFTHATKQNSPPGSYHYPPGRQELSISPERRFLKIFFPEEKGERGLWSWKKYQNQQRFWSHALLNSTIFETFTFLVCFAVQ